MENPAKKVLLTSNGDGISRNIAFHLAKQGCRLVLMGNEGCLRKIGEKIMGSIEGVLPVEVIGIDMEADNEEAFDEAVEKAFQRLGYVDAFVNCYAYEGKMQDILQVSEDEFKRITKINLMAPWFLVKAVGRRMKENEAGGSIVLMATIASAERGLYPGAAAYSASSAGVHQLVRTSAMEMGKHKVRVNMIARGLHLGDEYPSWVGRERAERMVKDAAPLGRWLDQHKDVVSTVIYLISDSSRFMTGTSVFVDGAQSLVRPRLKSFM
ncbi:PREDICTED: carbonyl reductase [NADPH] 2 [Tarenaya hassleriana]|uniref:carbonyl reductase [NADPH] 2 n=1 Tax=Tarenaya hassleriana TaxID=28532 RepID=UPI00053C2118|nr:PREDICTED: carbonyl reductase [NADPH] 2 [Tarenaya hassleriana]